MLVVVTVTAMSVERWQNEEDTSNTCLHTPLSAQTEAGMVAIGLQMLPD